MSWNQPRSIVLSAGQDHHSGSQQSGDGQQHDPQSHGAGITGLDAGLSRLIVGILFAAVGALAILVVMAGGLDDFALGDGFTAGLADLIAGVAVLGAGASLAPTISVS